MLNIIKRCMHMTLYSIKVMAFVCLTYLANVLVGSQLDKGLSHANFLAQTNDTLPFVVNAGIFLLLQLVHKPLIWCCPIMTIYACNHFTLNFKLSRLYGTIIGIQLFVLICAILLKQPNIEYIQNHVCSPKVKESQSINILYRASDKMSCSKLCPCSEGNAKWLS